MNILFIHGNCPGQFLNIAPALAKKIKGEFKFLTFAENPYKIPLNDIEIIQVEKHRSITPDIHPYLRKTEEAILCGQAIVKEIARQIRKGFLPDIIISHGGMGYGLYIKSLLPGVRLITYMEWFFGRMPSSLKLDAKNLNNRILNQTRNFQILAECTEADEIVCPTLWQKKQFPDFLQGKIKILFDGVDTALFAPRRTSKNFSLEGEDLAQPLHFHDNQLLLTYGTRGMEPLRGFPEFMRAASVALQRYPNLHVIVFGRDRSAYGPGSSHPSGSWKEALLEELSGKLDLGRVHFPGLITMGNLSHLLARTNVHCAFTRPFVVSWGVFNAAAVGANILMNRFEGFDEVFDSPPRLKPVDLDDQTSVTEGVLSALAELPAEPCPPRSNLRKGLDLRTCLNRWYEFIDQGALRGA